MFKGKIITASTAAALGVSSIALALNPVDDSVDYEWRLAGASSFDSTIRDIVTFQLCDAGAGSVDVFVEAGSGHWEAHCVVGAAAGAASGDQVLFRMSNVGSGEGAVAVDNGTTMVPFLNVSVATDLNDLTNNICAANSPLLDPNGVAIGTEWTGCNAPSMAVADFAVSAVEPDAFVGALAPPSGAFADDSGVTVSPIAGLGVGIVTNMAFYEALQRNQFPSGEPNFSHCNPDAPVVAGDNNDYNDPATDAKGAAGVPTGHILGLTEKCMPKVAKSFVQNVLNGTYASILDIPTSDPAGFPPNDAFGNTLGGNAFAGGYFPSNVTLVLCRRAQGSGLHAQTSKFFLRTECGRASQIMKDGCDSNLTCGQIVETHSADEMSACLDAAQAGNLWAIGYQSVEENADLEHDFNWVKIDGMAPTLENQLSGRYDNFQEANLLRRGTPTGAAAGTASGYVGAPIATDGPKVVDIYNALAAAMSGPVSAEAMNDSDRYRHPFGNTGWGARIDAPTVVPFPQTFDPTTMEFDLPVNAGTHFNAGTLAQDSCFGPVHPEGVQLNP